MPWFIKHDVNWFSELMMNLDTVLLKVMYRLHLIGLTSAFNVIGYLEVNSKPENNYYQIIRVTELQWSSISLLTL